MEQLPSISDRYDPQAADLSKRRSSSENNSSPPQPSSAHQLLTRRQLGALVPYSPQHILSLKKRGLFPLRLLISANRVAWLASEVDAWIAVPAPTFASVDATTAINCNCTG